ncbi:aspartic peptidase domain-containing protein [Halenospora varia]|nr:aspartic peptidase domain-containing protein [Halenospora varia]
MRKSDTHIGEDGHPPHERMGSPGRIPVAAPQLSTTPPHFVNLPIAVSLFTRRSTEKIVVADYLPVRRRKFHPHQKHHTRDSTNFRALTDINSHNIFVPSIECSGHRCSEKEIYNSSASSTYVKDGERVQKYYQAVFRYGIVGNETLHLGSLELQDQQFIEMKVYDQGLLDQNMFSLSLAINGGDGDLTFGGVNEDFLEDGKLDSHKMIPENETDWQIGISRATFQGSGGTVLVDNTYNNKTHLQKNITYDKCTHLPTTPCDSRSLLPTLTFSFPNADGKAEQEVQLTGENYETQFVVQDRNLRDGEKIDKCVVMVDVMPDTGDPGNQYGEFNDMIVLGQAMMGTLVGVFDWDEKMIFSWNFGLGVLAYSPSKHFVMRICLVVLHHTITSGVTVFGMRNGQVPGASMDSAGLLS